MLTIPGKIPIRIHPFFWILIFLLGWLNSNEIGPTLVWAAVITVSVLVHEFGHALTALFFKQTVSIDLMAMGGLTSRRGPTLKLWQDFIIVLNGPLAGLLLYFLSLWLYPSIRQLGLPYLSYAFAVSMLVNFWWTILNLIPIQPMDGGKLLSILLESFLGMRGIKIALFISMVLAAGFSALFFLTGNIFMGAILMMFLFESYRSWKTSLLFTETDRNSSFQSQLQEADRLASLGHREDAVKILEEVRANTKKGALFLAASEHLAHMYDDQQKKEEALAILEPLQNKLSVESQIFLQKLYFELKEYNKALSLGNTIFKTTPSYDVALINSFCAAMKGDVEATVGWLQAAIREGLPHPEMIFDSPHFDRVRNTPQFAALKR